MRGSRTLAAAMLALAASAAGPVAADTGKPPLTVCADPDNLPYSNARQEGFENKVAALLAADLGRDLAYFWFPEHKGFIRKTLIDGQCDLLVSVPAGLPMLAETKPYFASSYVVVMRADDARHFTGFGDAWLADAKIGLQMVGNEGATTPPAVALSHRGFNQHITGFPMWGPEGSADVPGRIVSAVADGSVDVALVWGPFGGYFAKAYGGRLRVETVTSDPDSPEIPFVFPMAMGVRKSDTTLLAQVQDAAGRHAGEIAAILHSYDIPVIGPKAAVPQSP